MVVNKIGIHHSGPIGSNPLSKSSHLTEADINTAHQARWPDMPSELNGSFIGYNIIVWPDGSWKQYRFIGEETAAAKGSNFDTVHFCLIGNFTKGVETPTYEQKMKLKSLISQLLRGDMTNLRVKDGTSWSYDVSRIYSHRVLQPHHTSCFGDSLPDSWGRDLFASYEVTNDQQEMLIALRNLYQKLLELYRKQVLGSSLKSCADADVRG